MEQSNMPDYETIRAAVDGEKWAVKMVLECYADEIDQFSTIEKEQPDGSVKKEIDEDLRQALALKLIEAIPSFPLDKG